jgi:DNA polymerase-1
MKDLMDIKPYNLILIDAMNLCARMYHALKYLSYDGHTTGMLFGVMKKVLSLKKAYPIARIVFLWEGATSKRKSLSSSYKASRNRSDDGFRACVEEVKETILIAGVDSMLHYGLEADDLAGYMASKEVNPDSRILLISNDEDWIQYVRENVDIQRGDSGIESFDDLTAGLGFPPSKMGMWKILKGDKSDEIKGIYRIPTAVVRMLVNKCDSHSDFKEYPLSRHNEKWAKWEEIIEKSWDCIEENAELILYHPEWIEEGQIDTSYGSYKPNDLATIFNKYGMKSLIKELS